MPVTINSPNTSPPEIMQYPALKLRFPVPQIIIGSMTLPARSMAGERSVIVWTHRVRRPPFWLIVTALGCNCYLSVIMWMRPKSVAQKAFHDDVIKWKYFSVTVPLWGDPPITSGFPSQRPVTPSFDAFFDLHQNKWWSKQSRRRWFESPSRLFKEWEFRRSRRMPKLACNLNFCSKHAYVSNVTESASHRLI